MTMHAISNTPAAFPLGAFRRMGWAFLFLGISVGPTIRVGQEHFVVDVLPNFVGFLLIAVAANRLIPFLRQARGVRNLALALVYLSIPTSVQYSVANTQGILINYVSPFWPLMAVEWLLELALVWMLCGLVAGLAGRVGDHAAERRALSARIIYITLKIVLTAVLGSAITFPAPNLIVASVIGGLTIGLVLLVMMMRLMWRAERMCEESPEVEEAGAARRPGGPVFRSLTIGGVLLPVGLSGGAFYYYVNWKEAREEEYRKTSTSTYFTPARREFLEHLRAGRIDEAYAATTKDFRNRISRERFGDLAGRYADYRAMREQGGVAGGASVSSGSDRLTERESIEIENGKIVEVTLTIRRDRDSILLRRPPPVKVDEFSVEEKPAPDQAWPPRGPGR